MISVSSTSQADPRKLQDKEEKKFKITVFSVKDNSFVINAIIVEVKRPKVTPRITPNAKARLNLTKMDLKNS